MANVIEPCCADRQMPHLLREERGHGVLFQTQGDVTLKHLMNAVMLMSGDRPRTLTIAVPELTERMQRTVGKYMRLEWVKTLRLLTSEECRVKSEEFAATVKSEAPEAEIELAVADQPDGLLMFTGPDGTVAIQGDILDHVEPGLRLYAAVFGRTEGNGVRSVADSFNAYFRSRRVELSETITKAITKTESTETEVKEEKTKTKTKTKKAKDNEKSNQVVEEPQAAPTAAAQAE